MFISITDVVLRRVDPLIFINHAVKKNTKESEHLE